MQYDSLSWSTNGQSTMVEKKTGAFIFAKHEFAESDLYELNKLYDCLDHVEGEKGSEEGGEEGGEEGDEEGGGGGGMYFEFWNHLFSGWLENR